MCACLCVCECVGGWDSPDLLASSAAAAPAIQLKSGEGGTRPRVEEGSEKRESPGPNKDMGARAGLGPCLL